MKSGKIGAKPRTFQELIFALQRYWSDQGCVILQPYDMEVGAGTFHTATFLRSIGPEPWSAAYVQPSRRPTDGRYGDNPFRLQHYYQFQVLIKPSPADILERYLGSLEFLGLDPLVNDVRFVEDNWESPTLGAWGLGWEVWLNVSLEDLDDDDDDETTEELEDIADAEPTEADLKEPAAE